MDQEMKEIIQKSEELAESASEKYQQSAFREFLKYHLRNGRRLGSRENQNSHRQKTANSFSNSATYSNNQSNNEVPEAYLVAEKGILKHQVAWAVIQLTRDGREATVNAVQQKIDIDLSVSKPRRDSTSKSLGRLVPKYLERKEAEESQGYAYLPTSKTSEVFEDIYVE